MKKFKTRSHKRNKEKNIFIILIMFLLIILFVYISSKTLTNSYSNFVNVLLKEQRLVKENTSSFFSLWTNNLDLLLNSYYFKSEEGNSSLVSRDLFLPPRDLTHETCGTLLKSFRGWNNRI